VNSPAKRLLWDSLTIVVLAALLKSLLPEVHAGIGDYLTGGMLIIILVLVVVLLIVIFIIKVLLVIIVVLGLGALIVFGILALAGGGGGGGGADLSWLMLPLTVGIIVLGIVSVSKAVLSSKRRPNEDLGMAQPPGYGRWTRPPVPKGSHAPRDIHKFGVPRRTAPSAKAEVPSGPPNCPRCGYSPLHYNSQVNKWSCPRCAGNWN
jgi:hypothetical protein